MSQGQLIKTFQDARLPAVLCATGYYFWRRGILRHHRGGHGGVPAFAHWLGLVEIAPPSRLRRLPPSLRGGGSDGGLAKPVPRVHWHDAPLCCGYLKWPPRALLPLHTFAMNILRFSDLCAQGNAQSQRVFIRADLNVPQDDAGNRRRGHPHPRFPSLYHAWRLTPAPL